MYLQRVCVVRYLLARVNKFHIGARDLRLMWRARRELRWVSHVPG